MTEIKNKLEARNIGLDFARIFAMLGVVILHVLGNGGLLTTVGPTDKRFWIAYITEIFAYGSVNLFGLLSGYLSVGKKRFSTYRILDLIFTVIFYCVLITALFFAFGKNLLSELDTVAYGLEFYKMGTYWYVFSYIVLFFLMPYINILINDLETKALGRLCLVIFILFSVVTTATATDVFRLNRGYNSMWIIFCYMIGAYLKKSGKTFSGVLKFPSFCCPFCRRLQYS